MILNNPPEYKVSEEIHEVMTRPPNWIVKWGISLILAIVLSIFMCSMLINYPDVIKAQVKINSNNSPKPIVSKVSGKIISILVENNEYVTKNQTLAYIESTADHNDILIIYNQLIAIQKKIKKGYSAPIVMDDFQTQHLGNLQGAYELFSNACLKYNSSLSEGISRNEKPLLIKS